MTIKELYEWAVSRGAENLYVEIQYRDDGGYYHGTDLLYEENITIDFLRSTVTI